MQIKTIKYRELFTWDYNNYAVEMEADVAPHEDADQVMHFLKKKVQAALKSEVEFFESTSDRIDQLHRVKCRLEQEVRDIMEHVRYQEHISKVYGVPGPSQDLPF